MKLFKLLLFLVIPSLIFHPLQAYERPSYHDIINVFQKKTALIERITIDGIPHFDLIISLLEDIENDTIDEDIDIQELNEFLVLLLRFGFHGTQEEWEALERDNKALLEGTYGDDEDEDYDEYYEDDLSFANYYSGKIILCGGVIKKTGKAIKKTGKSIKKGAKDSYGYVKDHKKEAIIIAAGVIGVVVLGTVVLPALAGATAAAIDSSSHDDKKQDSNPSKVEALLDSSHVYAAIEEPLVRDIVQERIETIREEINAEPSIDPDPSILDKARELGSYIAHQVLDGATEIISPLPDALDNTKEFGSQCFQREESSISNNKSLKENFENLIAKGHEIIDDAFSTDLAKHFSHEETGYENDWSVGTIPPPGGFGTTVIQENKLLEAGKAIDRAGFTKAGRGLMKHGYREGSVFPKPVGNPAQINEHGQQVLEMILNHPERKVLQKDTKSFGKIIDIKVPGIGGARYTVDGDFIGFLEP